VPGLDPARRPELVRDAWSPKAIGADDGRLIAVKLDPR
jgi:hypothetical protein